MAQKIAVTKSEDSKSPFDKLSKRELQVMMQVFRGQKIRLIAETLKPEARF